MNEASGGREGLTRPKTLKISQNKLNKQLLKAFQGF
jgi:hypothetical protein